VFGLYTIVILTVKIFYTYIQWYVTHHWMYIKKFTLTWRKKKWLHWLVN